MGQVIYYVGVIHSRNRNTGTISTHRAVYHSGVTSSGGAAGCARHALDANRQRHRRPSVTRKLECHDRRRSAIVAWPVVRDRRRAPWFAIVAGSAVHDHALPAVCDRRLPRRPRSSPAPRSAIVAWRLVHDRRLPRGPRSSPAPRSAIVACPVVRDRRLPAVRHLACSAVRDRRLAAMLACPAVRAGLSVIVTRPAVHCFVWCSSPRLSPSQLRWRLECSREPHVAGMSLPVADQIGAALTAWRWCHRLPRPMH